MNELQLDDLRHFLSDVKIGTSTEHELTSDEAAYLLSLIERERWVPVEEALPEIGERGFSEVVETYNAEYTEFPFEAARLFKVGNGATWTNWKFTPTHWKRIAPPTKERIDHDQRRTA